MEGRGIGLSGGGGTWGRVGVVTIGGVDNVCVEGEGPVGGWVGGWM